MKKVLLRALELAFEKVDILTQKIADADARHQISIDFEEILERDIEQKEANIEKLEERISLLQLGCAERDVRIEELESLAQFNPEEVPDYPTLFTLDNIVYFENSNGVFMELQDGEHVGVPVQITYEEYTVAVNRYINQ